MSYRRKFNKLVDDTESLLKEKSNEASNELYDLFHGIPSVRSSVLCGFYLATLCVVIGLCITIVVKISKMKPSNINNEVAKLKDSNKKLQDEIDAMSKLNKKSNKESMSPAQRIHLAHAYSKIGSEYNNKNKYDTTLKNPNNDKRKLRNNMKIYNNIEKAGNPMNVARGGVPMNYEKKAMQGKSNNMQALDNATLNGTYGPASDPIGGKSDIVKVGNSTRMAGINQDLSAFVGITSAKH